VLQEITLGLVQGLTEFLPISSSGHLVVVPALFDWEEPSLTFDILLHMGTLAAVVIYFRAELWRLTLGFFGRGDDVAGARRMLRLLVVGTVPAGVIGLAFEGLFEDLFHSPLWVCGELLATAALLVWMERLGERAKQRQLDDRVALTMGVAQAAAIAPGISRSGSTIGAGLWLGLTREEATRFSFLLSIPAIAGAGLVSLKDVSGGEFEVTGAVVAGMVVSGISGYLSIGFLLRLVRTTSLRVFAAYLLVFSPVAALIIVLR
jgi:undecaprenyl-diphosphatase